MVGHRGQRPYAVRAAAVVVLAFAAWVAAGGLALASSSEDYATKFHVDFTVNEDGSVDVAENITWHFPDGEDRHGIERFITVRAGYDADRYREYPMSDVSATSPSGAPADVSVSETSSGSSVRICIGSPDETVSGTQSYVVRYRLGSVVNGFDTHAEFYYNLID